MDSYMNPTTTFDVTMKIQPLREVLEYKSGQCVTILDGNQNLRIVSLDAFNKAVVTFGRGAAEDSNEFDIVLTSPLVSRFNGPHGRFIKSGGRWMIEDMGSTNGLIYNNSPIKRREVCDGDFIRIDNGFETIPEGVLFVFSSSSTKDKWNSLFTRFASSITIGRSGNCTIRLPHVNVSQLHAKIELGSDGYYYLYDLSGSNGIIVNNVRVSGKRKLQEKDVIVIANSKIIFTSNVIYYYCFKSGITVDASDVVIERKAGFKRFTTCNRVSLNVKPGELVAIVGGSGAGKSTVLNAMCGYLKPKSGHVYINGVDLYQNFDSMKKMIGYVPQADIVYDNLTLHDMLAYTAKLRLPKDTSKREREEIINSAIETVELSDKKQSLIKSLSGGQRKRASIAVELLSDPNLLFLDEPASGLDPGTERTLMNSLRSMANSGKTIILVTHSTLQLKMCDKIAFMGKGGNLCFFGSYESALNFFGVDDVVEIYNMITDHAVEWCRKYYENTEHNEIKTTKTTRTKAKNDSFFKQLTVLCSRYIKLVVNDKQRLLLLLLQAPILAALISIVADGNEFTQYEMTKSLLFALSCSAFWIGMLNSIQEICKERSVLKREYMTGLSLGAYIVSKIVVLGLLCVVQSLLVTSVFAALVGVADEGILLTSFAEILITTFLTAMAASAMGLFVSSLFTNADRAMTVAPILLMPQILFSGLIFDLGKTTEIISWFAVCRWSMEGYGTSANLNELPLSLQEKGVNIIHVTESFYEYTVEHIVTAWGILLAFVIVFLLFARCVIGRIGKKEN